MLLFPASALHLKYTFLYSGRFGIHWFFFCFLCDISPIWQDQINMWLIPTTHVVLQSETKSQHKSCSVNFSRVKKKRQMDLQWLDHNGELKINLTNGWRQRIPILPLIEFKQINLTFYCFYVSLWSVFTLGVVVRIFETIRILLKSASLTSPSSSALVSMRTTCSYWVWDYAFIWYFA